MPITELYSEYFQKSKTFLLPTLGIGRCNQTTDLMTFISWPGRYKPTNYKLIVCKKDNQNDREYMKFEKVFLVSNVFFEYMEKLDNTTIAYVFDLEKFQNDWNAFLEGKYSKLSPWLKERIKAYFGENTKEWSYIKSFLYPEKYFEQYADLLYDENDRARGFEYLMDVGELCAKWDFEKETLNFLTVPLDKSL
jgi:hypothetical protein